MCSVHSCVYLHILRAQRYPRRPETGKGNLKGNLIDCGGDQVNSVLKKEKCREIDDREVPWAESLRLSASGQSLRASHNKALV